jgi:hypothetical protein
MSSSEYIIGNGSSFDLDMSIVINMVKFHNGFANEDTIFALKSYYQSSLYSYWGVFKDFLINIDVDNIKYRNLNLKNLNNFIDNFEKYQEVFDNLMKSTFMQSSNESFLENLQKTFTFITKCFCLYLDDDEETKDLLNGYIWKPNYYPLPNGEGLFGLNTYLYAYFNNIYIIGVPNRIQNFDAVKNACPARFSIHDIDHSNNILPIDEEYKLIYNKIINLDNDLTLEKEIHCLIMWVIIHEIGDVPEHIYQKNPKDVVKILLDEVPEPVIVDFYREFIKYTPKILNRDSFNLLKAYFPEKDFDSFREKIYNGEYDYDVGLTLFGLMVYFSFLNVKKL